MTSESDLPAPVDLFIAHAPRALRNVWRWLWRVDTRLLRLATEPGETTLAQIRLAWWRAQLSGEGDVAERRDPLLVDIDAMTPSDHAAASHGAMRLVDAVEAMLLVEDGLPCDAAEQRGAALSGLLARWGDRGAESAASVGRYWGLSQLAPVADPAKPDGEAWRVRIAALACDANAAARLPRAISLMRLHAHLLERSDDGRLGAAAGLRLSLHGLTGF